MELFRYKALVGVELPALTLKDIISCETASALSSTPGKYISHLLSLCFCPRFLTISALFQTTNQVDCKPAMTIVHGACLETSKRIISAARKTGILCENEAAEKLARLLD